MKRKIKNLDSLKKKYSLVYDEVLEQFSNNNKKLKNFELDYFEYDTDTNIFYLSMSSGVADELIVFDMHGELLDDELSVNSADFNGATSDDIYSNESRESYDDDEQHDNDF